MMKKSYQDDIARHGVFSLGKGAIYYVFVLIFAVIFTQALRSPVSVVFLWFAATLPILSFFYALIGRANIGAFVLSDETTVEKLTPVGYEFRVSNYSFLPLPFTETEIFLPTKGGISCESRLVRLSILPRGEYRFKSDVTFRYRGSYRVGVGCVYVYDPLCIFRLRRNINIFSKILVMPRQIVFPREDEHSPSDTPTDSRVTEGSESSEANIIREYRGGDPLKHIHWKLSSKLQDLQVNEYKPNSGRNVYIFCDFATLFRPADAPAEKKRKKRRRRDKAASKETREVKVNLKRRVTPHSLTTEEKAEARAASAADKASAALAVSKERAALLSGGDDILREDEAVTAELKDVGDGYEHANDIKEEALPDHDAFCADGVSELTVGIVLHELDCGNSVTVLWFDERADDGYFMYDVATHAEMETFFRHFGTAPICDADMKVSFLPTLLDDTDSPTFIYVTSSAGLDELGDFINASRGAGAESTEVMLFDPKDRFESRDLHDEYIDVCRLKYAENKIKLTVVEPLWETEKKSGSDR